jgi:Zn-dependent peptidase ImmA (M78 family)
VTTHNRRQLAQRAMLKSIDVRTEAGLNLMTPICIYDLCESQGLRVRFVNINMEGSYFRGNPSLILLSALRPMPRRNFTCAHELGHHVFGHGSTVDKLIQESKNGSRFKPDEFLVDCFGGFLLMPTLGVRRAFASRGWDVGSANATQLYTVACSFGVGYETLIDHMTYSLFMLDQTKAESLRKVKLNMIRNELLGRPSPDPLVVADEQWLLPTVDAEVGTTLLFPKTAVPSNNAITLEGEYERWHVFKASRPGIARVCCTASNWAVFARVSRVQFEGLSKYRHLEEVEDDQFGAAAFQ